MQSGRGGVVASSRTSGEPIRRPGPIWLLPRPPRTWKESLLRSEYFATLIQAFFLSLGLQIALALAAILGFAVVVSSGASALAFALVDAAAMHNLRCGFLRFALFCGERGIGREQGSYSGRNERSLYHFSVQHRSSFECCTAVIGPLPDGAGRWQEAPLGALLLRWTGSHGYRFWSFAPAKAIPGPSSIEAGRFRYFHQLVPEAEGRGAVLRRKTTRWQVGTSPDGQPRDPNQGRR